MSGFHDGRILRALLAEPASTQRTLSQDLGVALGLTNLLIKRLVAKGYVRVVRLRARHARYLVTAEGRRVLLQETRDSMQNTVSLYTETRDLIRRALNELAARSDGAKDVVFYGLGDVAEIAFVSLQSTQLRLVGAVDDTRRGRFFGIEIQDPVQLTETGSPLSTVPVIVTTVRRVDEIRDRLHTLQVAWSRVSFLDATISDRHRLELFMSDTPNV
jgi:DNA-binding MarR family transcriptional regulator